MSCDKYARMIIKQGTGIATVPASSDHRNGDWIATDIYDGELYLDTATGIIYTSVNGVIQIAVYGTSTNFANTDLTFDANRTHNTDGFDLEITTDGGGYAQSWLFMGNTEEASLGFGGQSVQSNSTSVRLSANNTAVATVTDSNFAFNASVNVKYVAKTANYTATSANYLIDCTANTFTVTLPTAVGITGRQYVVNNSGTGVITVDADGTETINGALTVTLNQYDSVTVVSNGANWIKI